MEFEAKVNPLTLVGVIAPRVKANAPLVFVAETPFAVVTESTRYPDPVEMYLSLKVLAVTSPVPLILTSELGPTEKRDKGLAVPIPILPLSQREEFSRVLVSLHLAILY